MLPRVGARRGGQNPVAGCETERMGKRAARGLCRYASTDPVGHSGAERSATPPRYRAAERARLRVERDVDQHVIVEVHHAVEVEVAVAPTGAMRVETRVDPNVIVERHAAVE